MFMDESDRATQTTDHDDRSNRCLDADTRRLKAARGIRRNPGRMGRGLSAGRRPICAGLCVWTDT